MSTSTRIHGKITVIKRNGSNGSQFPVTGSTCTFGRESDCEIRIQLPNVSSHECQLLADENGRFVVSKLNKKGEILVNDKALAAQVAVNHNDVLTIAGRSFRFEYPPQQREKMAAAKVVAGTPRPSAVDRLRQTERRRVSFGPQLSPEQFDLKLPPNTPVKKGAIPMKNLSNTDDISQHHSLLKTAKRRSIGKSASQKATDGKKEKPAKKRSFDKLVELVGLDKPKKTEPNEVEDKTTKAASAGQLDFFGAIKKTPKAAVTGHTKNCCTSLQISSSESKQDETKELETVTPVDKKKPTTPAEKRRSMSKSTAPTGNEVETAASKSSKSTDQKKRRSKVVTPQPLEEASPNDLEDEPKTDDGKVSSQKRRSTKSSGDLDDTLPVEVGEVKPTTPAQKRQSMTKDVDDVVQEDASDVVVTASVQKKRRSKVATPQPSREVCDASLPESAATSDDHSDVTQGDRSEPITPKQKKKSMSKIATPTRDEETEKHRKFSKVQTPKTPVQAAATSEQEAVTPLHKQRSMSKSAKKDDQRGTSSAAATPKVSEVLTHATKRKSLSKQQSDSLDDTVAVEESLPIDDDNQKKIVLIVQEQTPARQPESTPQSPDMILEIGVQTPAAPPSSKNTPRLSSVTPRSETPFVKAEEGSIETPVAVPSSKKTRRVSRRSMAACPEIPLVEAEHAGEKTPMTLLSSKKMPRSSRRSKTPHSNIPSVETTQQSCRSMIAEAAKSLYQIPSNSAILTARRKSLRHRKSGVLLWSDVVRKNANKHLEPKTEAVQLQKVTKAARRSLLRTPKRAQNLRHVDSPATIYIRRKMKPRRSFTPAPLDMSGDWTSDDGNTTVEDSFVLSQSTVNNGDVTMDYEADPRVRTPKVKGQPVEDNFGTKRLLETPKEKVKGQPVEEHLGTKRLLKTPKDKVKGQAVEEHFGTKRLLKTPKDKVKGQPVDDHFGTKRLVKTPKDKVKGQPVEEHFGTKRLLTTPKCKVKGHPVEEHFGTKRLLKTPQEKVKGQPVEEHFGTKRLLKTPKDKVKGQPVDKHFGTKRLLRTPVDKVKGEAVQDEFGTKRLFCSPKVKGQPVEYNFGMKRLLNVPETKHKNEPVEDDLCLEQIFGYEADVDETPSDETQPSVNEPPAASKKSAGKTSKAKSTKSSTVDADEKSVERVHTRTRKSERKQSSESDSNEKRATRNSKVKSTDVEETPSDSDKPQPTDPSTASKTTRSKLTEQRKSSDTESDSGEKRATRRTKVKSGDVTETESSRSARKRRQSDDSDSSESAPKKKGARSKGRPTKKDIAAPASSQDSVGTPNTRRSSRSRVQKTSDDMPEKPKVVSPKTKLTAIPEVEEPAEAVAAELTPVEQTSGEQVKAQEPDDEPRRASKRTNAPLSKAAEKPSTTDIGATESETATDMKASAVRSSRRGKAVLDQPDTTTAQEEAPEPKKAVKKTQSAAGKKVKATAVKTTEASQSTRVSRRGRPALANEGSELLKNEPVAKKAKSEAKQVEPPARRTTKAAKSEPAKDDSKQEEKETKRAATTRKRKTSNPDAPNAKDASGAKPSIRKQKVSDDNPPKSKKIAEAKPSRPTRSAAAAPEPVRKSTRVRKAK